MLKKQNRLSKKFEFHVTKKYGGKLNGEYFFAYYLTPRNYMGQTKVGFVTSSKIFKTSVSRNKAKRIFREIFRKKFDKIPDNFWIVIFPKYNCLKADYEKICSDVDKILSEVSIA